MPKKKVKKTSDNRFLMVVVCLVCIPFLLILLLVMAQSCNKKATGYEGYRNKMVSATKKYLKNTDNMPKEQGDYVKVDLATLIEQDYINSPEEKLKDTNCSGYVGVRVKSKTEYTAVLKCDNYKVLTLRDSILDDLTTEGNGVYDFTDRYIFRGTGVNNYIKVADMEYRIISMSKNGVVKLFNASNEQGETYWDNKYNITVDMEVGINNYNDSNVLEVLNNAYNSHKSLKKVKQHLVTSDICVNSKYINDGYVDKTKCVEVLKNQYITLLDLDDFKNASLDSNCNILDDKACSNYNYLSDGVKVNTWTKDIVSNNNYQAYALFNGRVYSIDANMYEPIQYVIFIDGDTIIDGNGSKDNPYILN